MNWESVGLEANKLASDIGSSRWHLERILLFSSFSFGFPFLFSDPKGFLSFFLSLTRSSGFHYISVGVYFSPEKEKGLYQRFSFFILPVRNVACALDCGYPLPLL